LNLLSNFNPQLLSNLKCFGGIWGIQLARGVSNSFFLSFFWRLKIQWLLGNLILQRSISWWNFWFPIQVGRTEHYFASEIFIILYNLSLYSNLKSLNLFTKYNFSYSLQKFDKATLLEIQATLKKHTLYCYLFGHISYTIHYFKTPIWLRKSPCTNQE